MFVFFFERDLRERDNLENNRRVIIHIVKKQFERLLNSRYYLILFQEREREKNQ
jgi:hypothetical protein